MSYNEPPNYGTPPPPPPGGQPYGAGGVGQPQQTSVLAIISLVTGILGLCCAGWFVLPIAALVLGFLGKKEVDEGKKKGKGLALAGLILGAIGIVLGILNWVLVATGVIDLNYYSDVS